MHAVARLKITEIFHSIQGESTLAGERFSFVRLMGCPLRCSWCDTTYSFQGGDWKTIPEIVQEVLSHETKYVLVTGGEPLAQKGCLSLVKTFFDEGLNVSIETSGEKLVADYVAFAKIIMDIKTPSSQEKAELCFENLKHLKSEDEVKFVIADREDYEWSRTICKERDLENRNKVLFSPVFGTLPLQKMADWIIEDRLNVRLQTQLHKQIWGENVKGV